MNQEYISQKDAGQGSTHQGSASQGSAEQATPLVGLDELNDYAARYDHIQHDFLEAAASFGLNFAEVNDEGSAHREPAPAPTAYEEQVRQLTALGAHTENDSKSIFTTWKSPACVACMKGVGTETFLTSTKCPRNCYFCFNPNQQDYEYFLTHENPIASQLEERARQGVRLSELAITGGEPLLHLPEVLRFLEVARREFPQARTRLYTSAFGWTPEVRDKLEAAGLTEVRFSIKMEESTEEIEKVLTALESAVGHFEAVMVEMPVMPDQQQEMEQLLVRLNEIGANGINLLELCFPFNNAHEFAKRGYLLKPQPYRVLYNYWYGGGLPIFGSEEVCLNLVRFALDNQLQLGVHYCSLENKLTGQVYQQNFPVRNAFKGYEMDGEDFFLKSVKVFGAAIPLAQEALQKAHLEDAAEVNEAFGFLQMTPSAFARIQEQLPQVAVGLSFAIAEEDGLHEVGLFRLR